MCSSNANSPNVVFLTSIKYVTLTKEQATTYFAGLRKIESSYSELELEKGQLKSFILIFHHPVTFALSILPLLGIDENKALWDDVLMLFDKVRKMNDGLDSLPWE